MKKQFPFQQPDCTGSPTNSSGYCNATGDCNSVGGYYGVNSWCDPNGPFGGNCSRWLPGPTIPEFHYCNYDGINDKYQPGVKAVCCPSDYNWDEAAGACQATDECYPIPPGDCAFDYENPLEHPNWITDGTCNNATATPTSTACCVKIKFGNFDYYSDNYNVVIY